MSLTLEVYDAVLIVIQVYYWMFYPVLRNRRTNLICPPKLEDKINLSSETGGQVLQFKKSKLWAMTKMKLSGLNFPNETKRNNVLYL